MRKILQLALLLLPAIAFSQNVRYDAPFPSITQTGSTPYLVANVPPNSPILAVCHSPANAVPCTNYATTFDSLANSCLPGAQDTPQPQPSACQATGDSEGNIGFWAPAGTYDYTVCVSDQCFGPYTVTLGGSGSGGGGTVKVNNGAPQAVTNLNGVIPAPDVGFSNVTFQTDGVNVTAELPNTVGGITGATVGGGLLATGPTLGLKLCSANQVLQWNTTWDCATIAGSGNTFSATGTLNRLTKYTAPNTIGNSNTTDDGTTTTIGGSGGLLVNSGGSATILGVADSGINCPVSGLTTGWSYWCSGSFLPLWITDIAGVITQTQAELQSNKGIANGYANLDGSGNVPSTELDNYPGATFLNTGNTVDTQTTTAITRTLADYGASPATAPNLVTDNSSTSTDSTPNLVLDTGASSFHRSFAARIRGTNQIQVCQQQSGAQGQVVFGSAVACTAINNTPFAKVVEESNTAGHSILRLYQNSTSDNNTGGMMALTNATAAGSGWFYAKGCAGATGSDTGVGSGTCNWTINGNGLFTGTFAVGSTAHGVVVSEGTAAAAVATSVGTAGQVLTSNGPGVDPNFQTPSSGFSNPMTTLGDIMYENATPAAARLAGPTGVNLVPQVLTSIPASSAATAPLWAPAGVVPRASTCIASTNTDIVLVTDRAGYISWNDASSCLVTLPQAGSSGFGSNFVFVGCDIGAGTATVTPTTSTISYSTGSVYTSAASSMPLTTGQCALVYSDNANYIAIRTPTGAGTVTSVATAAPITGGTFPVSGTIGCATCVTSAAALTSNAVVIGGGLQASSTISADSTTTHALMATAGAPAFRALVAGDLPAALVYNNAANTGTSAMTLDLSAGSVTAGLKLPSAAGAVPTADGFDAFNTTNHTQVWGSNGTTIVGAAAATGTNTATTCTNQFVSAVSGVAVPTCTTVTLAGAQFANQGTTTTVLHGNGAGNPAFSAIATGDIAANAVTSAKVDGSVANATTGAFSTQTDGATVTWAVASAYQANAVLTFTVHSGSRTLNLTGLVNGGNYVLKLIQDGTGGEGLTLGTGCTWKVISGGAGTVTLTNAANAVDILAFTYDGTNCLANIGKNYN